MNLFMWLSQFGLTGELFGERLAPIGSVYDPFIARGLDALIYALYVKSRFILVGTPSGVTLAPEGGAHQSTVTPSLGIELPGLRAYEPVFGREVVWTLLEGIRGCLEPDDGFATYLRLATRPIDQSLAGPVEARLGLDGWREAVLAGGYRLIEAASAAEPLPPGSPVVQVVAAGSIVPEAIEAVRILHREEIAANLIVVTSAERLAAGQHGGRLAAMRTGTPGRHRPPRDADPAGRATRADRHRRRRRVACAELHRWRVRRARGPARGRHVRPVGRDPGPLCRGRHRRGPHRGGGDPRPRPGRRPRERPERSTRTRRRSCGRRSTRSSRRSSPTGCPS